jgi:hypothetical protein
MLMMNLMIKVKTMTLSPAKAGSVIQFDRLPRVPLATLASPWAKFFRLLRRLVNPDDPGLLLAPAFTLAAMLCVSSTPLLGHTTLNSAPIPPPSDQSEVRGAVQRIFNQLKAGEYEALYESLPSSSRSRLARDRFVNALQRTRDLYRLDRIEIGAIRMAGDLAVVDTVMYAHIAKPIEGDGKLVVQQYLVKENGTWRVATGDRATIDRFLKSNPSFARKFPIRRPRAFINENGSWIEIPLGARQTGKRT